jgi:hypothetical protein
MSATAVITKPEDIFRLLYGMFVEAMRTEESVMLGC